MNFSIKLPESWTGGVLEYVLEDLCAFGILHKGLADSERQRFTVEWPAGLKHLRTPR